MKTIMYQYIFTICIRQSTIVVNKSKKLGNITISTMSLRKNFENVVLINMSNNKPASSFYCRTDLFLPKETFD